MATRFGIVIGSALYIGEGKRIVIHTLCTLLSHLFVSFVNILCVLPMLSTSIGHS